MLSSTKIIYNKINRLALIYRAAYKMQSCKQAKQLKLEANRKTIQPVPK